MSQLARRSKRWSLDDLIPTEVRSPRWRSSTRRGADVRDEAFWQGGFDVIAEMIDELERLEAA